MTPRGNLRHSRRAVIAIVPGLAALVGALLVLLPAPATASGAGSVTALDTTSASPGVSATDSTAPNPSPSSAPPSSVPPSATPSPTVPEPTPPRPGPVQIPVPHPHKILAPPQPARPHPKRKAWPVSVLLRTVPPLPGTRFSVDGKIFTAGADGTVAVSLEHDFTQHTLALLNPTLATADHRYAFYRWEGQRDPNQAFRTVVTGLPWRAPYAITAAFAEQCPVTPAFTDQHGAPLDVSALDSATVRSDTGQISALPVRGTSWLTCSLPVYAGGALVNRPLGYRLQSLMTGGTNVVDAGKQSFQPSTNPRPTFVGLYFNLTVTAHDALFGGATGRQALLTGPDHRQHAIAFPARHTATFVHLPRGDYSLTVSGTSGIALSKPIRLSRDSSADVAVVTGADLGSSAACGSVIAVSLPLVARHRRRWLSRFLGSRLARLRHKEVTEG